MARYFVPLSELAKDCDEDCTDRSFGKSEGIWLVPLGETQGMKHRGNGFRIPWGCA